MLVGSPGRPGFRRVSPQPILGFLEMRQFPRRRTFVLSRPTVDLPLEKSVRLAEICKTDCLPVHFGNLGQCIDYPLANSPAQRCVYLA